MAKDQNATSPALQMEVRRGMVHAAQHVWMLGAEKMVSLRMVAVFRDGVKVAQERALNGHEQGDLLDASASVDPALSELCKIFGWQGGTLAQALAEVLRLKLRVKSLEAFKASVDEALNSGDGSYRP